MSGRVFQRWCRWMAGCGVVLWLAWTFSAAAAAPSGAGPAPGVGPGARLLVTKVFASHGKLTAEEFQGIADAGFTVAVNRWPRDLDNQPVLEHYLEGAGEAGLDVMVWRSGLIDAADANDQTVTSAGKTTRYTAPSSPQAWATLRAEVVELATMALDHSRLKGVVLDFEIYDRNKTEGYCESYDDASHTQFYAALRRQAPDAPAAQRSSQLKNAGLRDRFVAFQVERVRQEAVQLRQSIDAVNPAFQIGVYGWGVMVQPVEAALATPAAPVLRLSATTYGRTAYSNAFDGGHDAAAPDRSSLQWSLRTVCDEVAHARRLAYPLIVLAGHCPQSPGPADGKQFAYTARQAFQSALYADGYWIWTDWQPPAPYTSRQAYVPDLLKAFDSANNAVVRQDGTWSNRQPDQIAESQPIAPHTLWTMDRRSHIEAWDPYRGEPRPTEPAPSVQTWANAAQANLDGLPGLERVRLDAGRVIVTDAADRTLWSFRVNPAAERFMLEEAR